MILEAIHDPRDIKALNDSQTQLLCTELREFLLKNVSKTGGHLASNLGAVELTVAIHRVFDTSRDRLGPSLIHIRRRRRTYRGR